MTRLPVVFILALVAVGVGILTNTELMAAGVIATVITFTLAVLGHMNARSRNV